MAFVSPLAAGAARSTRHAPANVCTRSSFRGAQLARERRVVVVVPGWAMNISTNDFRNGTTIEIDRIVYRVVEFLHVKPGKGPAMVKTKLKNMMTGGTIDKTFRAGEMVQNAQLDKVSMQHTYVDGDDYVFMNMETFDEERMTADVLGENAVKFMMEGLDVEVLKHADAVLGVEIPKTMSVIVTQTDPGLKGNTAQGGGTKPAIVETGAEVYVPLFINNGEKIRVSTDDCKYLSRDNEKN